MKAINDSELDIALSKLEIIRIIADEMLDETENSVVKLAMGVILEVINE